MLRRTPPKTPTITQSDPDLSSLVHDHDPEATNITSRFKRQRAESSSPGGTPDDFKAEMRAMMTSLQNNQTLMFKKLSEDIMEIKTQNTQIQKTNSDIEKCLESIKTNQDKMSSRIDKLENERQGLLNHIYKLEAKINDLDLGSRPSSVELRNVPCAERETANDLLSYITNTGRVIGVNIRPSDIRDTYRLPAQPGKTKIIVTEFTTVSQKNDFLAAVRKYNDSRQKDEKLNSSVIGISGKKCPIYVSEYIAGSGRKLFFQCREFAKTNNFKYCWTVNNKIFIRKNDDSKPIRIDSEAVLNAIDSQ